MFTLSSIKSNNIDKKYSYSLEIPKGICPEVSNEYWTALDTSAYPLIMTQGRMFYIIHAVFLFRLALSGANLMLK